MRVAGMVGVAVLFTALTSYGQSASSVSPDEQALLAAEYAVTAAIEARDVAVLDRLMGPTFIAVYPDGGIHDRDSVLAATRNPAPPNPAPLELVDLKARIHGTTGIVTGRAVYKDTSFRFPDVYVKESDQWLAVATQSTEIAPDAN
jgi:Domain of unknown function (DUF4440)